MASKRFIDVEILGVQTVRRQLLRGAMAAGNMRPALQEIRQDIFRIIKINFESQGRRGGGSWKFLKEETILRKLNAGLDPRILIARGHLMEAFTGRDSRYGRSTIYRDRIMIDSSLPYADTHQYGDEGRGIPARPFVKFLPSDKRRWAKMAEKSLIGAMRGV